MLGPSRPLGALTRLAWSSEAHRKTTAAKVDVIQLVDGVLELLLVFHFDERDAFWTPRFPIVHDVNVHDVAVTGGEEVAEVIGGSRVRDVRYIQACVHVEGPF